MVTIEEAADFAFSRHCLRTVDASPSSRKSGYTWAMAKERQRKVGFGRLRHHLMSESDQAVRLMDKILHDPKDPELWELWYIPYNG